MEAYQKQKQNICLFTQKCHFNKKNEDSLLGIILLILGSTLFTTEFLYTWRVW